MMFIVLRWLRSVGWRLRWPLIILVGLAVTVLWLWAMQVGLIHPDHEPSGP